MTLWKSQCVVFFSLKVLLCQSRINIRIFLGCISDLFVLCQPFLSTILLRAYLYQEPFVNFVNAFPDNILFSIFVVLNWTRIIMQLNASSSLGSEIMFYINVIKRLPLHRDMSIPHPTPVKNKLKISLHCFKLTKLCYAFSRGFSF